MNEKNMMRLIAAMLAEIHQKMEIEDGVDSKLVAAALWRNQDWAILWEHEWLLDSEKDPDEVEYVVNVLNMWRWIEGGYSRLSPEDKGKVAAAVPYRQGEDPKFGGFDGNEEGEFTAVARMLIEHLDRFDEFSGRNLNTHSPTTARYKAMLQAHKSLSASAMTAPTADDLISVLSAG